MEIVLFINARIFTLDPEKPYLKDGYILVSGSEIQEIGDMKSLSHLKQFTKAHEAPGTVQDDAHDHLKWQKTHNLEGLKKVDLQGMIVLPGMVCSHSHFYGQFVRGMPMNQSMKNWQQILSRLWWQVDKALDEDTIYYSAMMGLMEGIKSGTTTFIDHHASPSCCTGSLDILERAVLQAGARGCLSYEVSDRDGIQAAKQGIEENFRFIQKNKKSRHSKINATFGLHASYTLSDETLEICAGYGQDLRTGFHIHVAEDLADVSDCYRRQDMHVVERLQKQGILKANSLAAHCVHVGPSEWEIFKQTDTKVLHNCQSNTNNAVGISPVSQMLNAGVKVALASDGYTYDMFKELAFAAILQRLAVKDPGAMNNEMLDNLCFYHNFEISRLFFGNTGILKKGNQADFIAVDYDSPTPVEAGNLYAHLTSGFSGRVHTAVIAGDVVLKDHKLLLLDEAEVTAKCREYAAKLWLKF